MTSTYTQYQKVFPDGSKVSIDDKWVIYYDKEEKEVTRSLVKYYYNNPYGYNCSSHEDVADKVHLFWGDK